MFKKKKQKDSWGGPFQMGPGMYEMDESMSYQMEESMPYHMEGPMSHHHHHEMYHGSPHYMQHHHHPGHHLKHETLMQVKKWVDYGMKEAKHTSYHHAMTEVAAISYLLGKGYPPGMAHQMVESWEKNEKLY
ncbi:hypothetical protein [Pseudalkalibacillus sp. SCS-8]|uniref:hypothetical protein n=1 Tax=Pseudalkalibacillus nanhaiensis TaxID=3115291 RepID=UPI0032DA1733